MLSRGPWFMSFRPLKAQIEFAFENAPVCAPVAEPATPGVPGGPATSPAIAEPTLNTPKAAAHAIAAKHLRISEPPLRMSPDLATTKDVTSRERACQCAQQAGRAISASATTPFSAGHRLTPESGDPSRGRTRSDGGRKWGDVSLTHGCCSSPWVRHATQPALGSRLGSR
jgi:hypothetical protein